MGLFKGKYRVKTWQELSASVATESDLSFKPVKKLPKKMQQGKHNYKTQKGWFKRQKIKDSAALKSDATVDGSSLSQGFFIYDSGSKVAYSGYPKQAFKDDMMEMLASQSFSVSARNQMSSSFTGVNWPDIVVIQEEYVTQSATVNIGWSHAGVLMSSSNWANHPASASIKFFNDSTDDIGMLNSFAYDSSISINSNNARLHPVPQFTLPITTASYDIMNYSVNPAGGQEFTCSMVLRNLESPGYTASDGTVNAAYTTAELAKAMEWKYTGSNIFDSIEAVQPTGTSAPKGFGNSETFVPCYDHGGNELTVKVVQQTIKTKIFGDDPDESPIEHPETIAIFSGWVDQITSASARRYAHSDVGMTGSYSNVTIYYVTRNDGGTLEPLGLGLSDRLGSFIFADGGLANPATPGVYTNFSPATALPSGAANGTVGYRTNAENALSGQGGIIGNNKNVRFSGSAT